MLPLVLLVLLTLRSSFFPYPEILTENYFLRQGLLPYTQINDQHFPGIFLLSYLTTVNQLRIIHLTLLVINLALLYLLLSKSSPLIKLLTLLTYVFYLLAWEGTTLWIDSLVATLGLFGFYLLAAWPGRKTHTYYFLTGLVFGLALLFKQPAILLCVTSCVWLLSFRPRPTQFALFVMGGLLPLGLTSLALLVQGVFPDFVFWTITHNLSGYTSLEGRAPTRTELIRFTSLAIPAVLALRSPRNDKLWYLLYLLSSIVFIYPRFGLIHAQIGLPIMLYLVARSSRFLLIMSCLLGCFFGLRFVLRDTPGEILFYDASTRITVDYVEAHKSSRPIYVYGVNDNIYHLTHTLPPQKTWIELLEGNIIPGVEHTLISTLVADPPQFVLVDPFASIDNHPLPEFTPQVWQYISSRYHESLTLPNGIQIWYPKTI